MKKFLKNVRNWIRASWFRAILTWSVLPLLCSAAFLYFGFTIASLICVAAALVLVVTAFSIRYWKSVFRTRRSTPTPDTHDPSLPHTERGGRGYHSGDWLWWLIGVPILVTGVSLILAGVLWMLINVISSSGFPFWSLWMLGIGTIVLVIGITFYRMFSTASPVVLSVRQLFGVPKAFLGCLFFDWKQLTVTVEIPGDRLIESTSDQAGNARTVTSAIKIGNRYGKVLAQLGNQESKDKSEVDYAESTIEALFIIKVVFYLDIWKMTDKVIETYYFDFQQGQANGRRKVVDQVMDIVVAQCDVVLQGKTLDQCLNEATEINKALMEHLTEVLKAIGVSLIQVTLERTLDLVPEGPIFQMYRATRVRTESRVQQENAASRQAARIAELKAQLQIADQERETYAKKVEVEKEIGKMEVQRLLERLAVYAGVDPAVAQLLAKLEQMEPAKAAEFYTAAAKSAGFNTQSGNITLVNGTTADGMTTKGIVPILLNLIGIGDGQKASSN